MTTKDRLTQKSLAALTRRLSGNIDSARFALAELAAQAKAEGVPGWAEIIGVECRRAPRTVMAWAATWEWCASVNVYEVDWARHLPYSFYETAARYSEKLGNDKLLELLLVYHGEGGATLESFRAELSILAGENGTSTAEFRTWADHERRRVLSWIDKAPTRRAGDCLRLAADALADALAAE